MQLISFLFLTLPICSFLPVSPSKEDVAPVVPVPPHRVWPLHLSVSVQEAWLVCLSVSVKEAWPVHLSASVKEAWPVCLSVSVKEGWPVCLLVQC